MIGIYRAHRFVITPQEPYQLHFYQQTHDINDNRKSSTTHDEGKKPQKTITIRQTQLLRAPKDDEWDFLLTGRSWGAQWSIRGGWWNIEGSGGLWGWWNIEGRGCRSFGKARRAWSWKIEWRSGGMKFGEPWGARS